MRPAPVLYSHTTVLASIIFFMIIDNRCVQNLKVESVDLALELVPLASSVFMVTVRNIYPIPEAPVKVRLIQTIVELSLTILMCM